MWILQLEISSLRLIKFACLFKDFHETQKLAYTLGENLVRRISYKCDNKCGNC